MLTSCWSQVVGTVTRITRQAATLSLLTVDGRPCRPDFTGIIRSQDVRQTAKDSVKVGRARLSERLVRELTHHAWARQIWSCFRPGDVVRAKVVRRGQSCSFLVLLTDIVMSADLSRRFAIMLVHLPCLPLVLLDPGDDTFLARVRRFPLDGGQLARRVVCGLDQDGRATRGSQLGRDARFVYGRGRGEESGRAGVRVRGRYLSTCLL